MVITKNGEDEILKTVVKAGTVIPCKTITINNLSPQRNDQKIIEIPICVGNKNKILHNIKIKSKNNNLFNLNTKIELKISINSDKLLLIKAKIGDNEVDIEPLNPFSNKEVSIKDRKRFEAEAEFNKSTANNHGKITESSLKKLYEKYSELGLEEILEQLYDEFNNGNLNNIGLHYSNAGDKEKAMLFYEKAMEKKPSSVTALNIAIQYRYENRELYKKWLKKSLDLDPNENISLYLYGVILVDEGSDIKGYKMINRAFSSWKIEYENDCLSSHISWFISCAKYLSKYKYALKLENGIKDNYYSDEIYNSSNLISAK